VVSPTFLKRTHQLSAFWAGCAATIGGVLLIPLALVEAVPRPPFVALAGIVLGNAGFAWLCVAIRCPQCGARIFWRAVTKHETESWFAEGGLTEDSCPHCGYRPGEE
jgi:DNA-directed RNA polymerase subunit RPC12/RpoP